MVAANNNIASLIHQKPSGDDDQRYLGKTKKACKKKKKPLYAEFSWTDNGIDADPCEHDFRDVVDGLTVVAGMLEVNQLNPQMGKRPLFSPTDSGRLMRMMVARRPPWQISQWVVGRLLVLHWKLGSLPRVGAAFGLVRVSDRRNMLPVNQSH